jgi:hypothetical protein
LGRLCVGADHLRPDQALLLGVDGRDQVVVQRRDLPIKPLLRDVFPVADRARCTSIGPAERRRLRRRSRPWANGTNIPPIPD